MKIAYICEYKALDVLSWSGLSLHIARALESKGHELVYVDCIRPKTHLYWKLLYGIRVRCSSRRFLFSREPAVISSITKQISQRLRHNRVDMVFSPGSRLLGKLKTRIPTVFYTDAVFAAMLDYYPEFTNLSQGTIRAGLRMERFAMDRCSAAIFATKWAAQSALAVHEIAPGKVHVIPFGSNLNVHPTRDDVKQFIEARSFSEIQLLFNGVDWERKGGNTALEITRRLGELGVPVRLHVVGCVPPESVAVSSNVKVHGFLNKNIPHDLERLTDLIKTSHFLVLPNLAECYGIVYVEANSFGVPALTTKTGGVVNVICEGRNGYLFAPGDFEGYCRTIRSYHIDRQAYSALALNSYDHYTSNATWELAATKLDKCLSSLMIRPVENR